MWDALKLYAKRSFLSYTEEHQPKDEKSTQLDEEVIDQNAQLKKNLRGAEQRLISDILLCTNEPESWEHFTKMAFKRHSKGYLWLESNAI